MIKLELTKKLIGSQGVISLSLNLELNGQELITLYGQSGAGKTTILRILAGLTQPEDGLIQIEGETWFDSSRYINLSPQKRRVGFLFQDYALFPNMTVKENLEFAYSKKDKDRVAFLLKIMDLKELKDRFPNTLSGGQKQRVALARALVLEPKLLLLDEPFSALDMDMRSKLQDEIIKIHKEFGVTTLLVSHDLSEVFKLSDLVLVLENGQITKSGKPADVFIEEKISGQFKLVGEILSIHPCDVIYVLRVMIGQQVVEVIATEEEIENFQVGTKVLVFAKTFNPMISKLG